MTWAAITHATSYGVYQSTTTATGTYTLQTTVTTTTWTSAALAAGTLLVRGGDQHRHQLGQRQVGGDRAAHHSSSTCSCSATGASPADGRRGRLPAGR